MVFAVGDTHYGKETVSYNPDVCLSRLKLAQRKVARIIELQPGYQFDALNIFFTGDMLDGACIFPTQVHHQAISDPLKQAFEFSEPMADWLLSFTKSFPHVHIHAVPGNHGRASKFHHENTNFDTAFYQNLALRLHDKRNITMHLGDNNPGEEARLHMCEVRKHKFLLHHGETIKMRNRVPWYGLENATKDWYIALGGFDELVTGHFHRCTHTVINNHLAYALTGTPVTDDDFTLAELKCLPANQWLCWGVSDSRARTWTYNIDLL